MTYDPPALADNMSVWWLAKRYFLNTNYHERMLLLRLAFSWRWCGAGTMRLATNEHFVSWAWQLTVIKLGNINIVIKTHSVYVYYWDKELKYIDTFVIHNFAQFKLTEWQNECRCPTYPQCGACAAIDWHKKYSPVGSVAAAAAAALAI